MDGWLGLTAF